MGVGQSSTALDTQPRRSLENERWGASGFDVSALFGARQHIEAPPDRRGIHTRFLWQSKA